MIHEHSHEDVHQMAQARYPSEEAVMFQKMRAALEEQYLQSYAVSPHADIIVTL